MGDANPGRRSAVLAAVCFADVGAIVLALFMLPASRMGVRLDAKGRWRYFREGASI